MTNDIGYDSKKALPNKLVQEDGTITDIVGREVTVATEAYDNKPALPNKFLNPDGSYSTLNAIIAEMIDSELFIVVEELPATGENNKIYLLVQGDKLIEYVWINDKWDPIGMVEFDIDNYYTKAEVTQLISTALQTAKDYADGKDVDVLQSAKNYTDTSILNYVAPSQIYNWGARGDKSQASLNMWTNVYKTNKTQDVLVTYYYQKAYNIVLLFIPAGTLETGSHVTPRVNFLNWSKGTNLYDSVQTINEYWKLTLDENEKVTNLTQYGEGRW